MAAHRKGKVAHPTLPPINSDARNLRPGKLIIIIIIMIRPPKVGRGIEGDPWGALYMYRCPAGLISLL